MIKEDYTPGTVITSEWLNEVGERLNDLLVSVKEQGFNAAGDGTNNDTVAFSAALASPATVIDIPAGTYIISSPTLQSNKTLRGAGSDKTILKIVPGDTGNIISGASVSNFKLEGVTLDYTGGGAGSGHGAFFSGCPNLTLIDVKTKATKGHGIWMYNCHNYTVKHIQVDTATDWGMLIDGALSTDGFGEDIRCTNCSDRGLMLRGVIRARIFGVHGRNNRATAAWMLDCLYSMIYGVTDVDDLVGDVAVIEGASIGCKIIGVTAKTCGGHTASISSSASAAPVNCHINDVYSDGAGEAIAVISDQGSGFKPTDCKITNVLGKNCGRVTPMEGFGLGNTVNCSIEGTITDTLGTMTYAVRETGPGPANNRFIIGGWVSGSVGYFQLGASTSTIEFSRLDNGFTRVGNADLSWEPGSSRRYILYDTAALTANRTVTLGVSWSGDTVRVARPIGGAFNLLVKQGASTLKTLTTGQWADFYCDGANWNPIGGGTI